MIYTSPCTSSWLLGRRPEFVDPRFVAQGEGRESELCSTLCYEKYVYLIYMYMYMYMYMYNIHGSIEDTHMYDLYTYVIMLHAVIGDLLLKVCRQ